MWRDYNGKQFSKYDVIEGNCCIGYTNIWEVYLAVEGEDRYLEECGRTFGLAELADELKKSEVVYILNGKDEVVFIIERKR